MENMSNAKPKDLEKVWLPRLKTSKGGATAKSKKQKKKKKYESRKINYE